MISSLNLLYKYWISKIKELSPNKDTLSIYSVFLSIKNRVINKLKPLTLHVKILPKI